MYFTCLWNRRKKNERGGNEGRRTERKKVDGEGRVALPSLPTSRVMGGLYSKSNAQNPKGWIVIIYMLLSACVHRTFCPTKSCSCSVPNKPTEAYINYKLFVLMLRPN